MNFICPQDNRTPQGGHNVLCCFSLFQNAKKQIRMKPFLNNVSDLVQTVTRVIGGLEVLFFSSMVAFMQEMGKLK